MEASVHTGELRKHHLTCPECVAQGGPNDVLIQEIYSGREPHGFKIWIVIFHREPNLPGLNQPPHWVGMFPCPYCGKDLETEEYEFWNA